MNQSIITGPPRHHTIRQVIGPRVFGPKRDILAVDMQRVIPTVHSVHHFQTGSCSFASIFREEIMVPVIHTLKARNAVTVRMTEVAVLGMMVHSVMAECASIVLSITSMQIVVMIRIPVHQCIMAMELVMMMMMMMERKRHRRRRRRRQLMGTDLMDRRRVQPPVPALLDLMMGQYLWMTPLVAVKL